MKYTQIEQAHTIQQINDEYLRTLRAPMDGMWEGAIIPSATFWEIQDQEGQRAGYFCLDSNHDLLRFHLLKAYQTRAQEIFRELISTRDIQRAITSTIEPAYFSLCLDVQQSMVVHSYLFRDHTHLHPSPDLDKNKCRIAEEKELERILLFYFANTTDSGEWLETFVRKRLKRAELFVLYNQQTLVATGECIPSQRQAPYADLGMVVAQEYRGQGFGSSMLLQMKQHCYKAGWEPICSCTADNLASKKAIEKAGFISEHRIVQVSFTKETSTPAH